jgi:hypothetical protein
MRNKFLWFFLVWSLTASIAVAATYKVITQEAVIRKDKRFFAPMVTRIPYSEIIEELERQGDWLRVNYKGMEGWIHVSAIQEQKFSFASLAGQRAEETTKEEVALAGKGFTPDVEKVFRNKNPNMRYDLVNQIQGFKLNDLQLLEFLRAGNLKEPGGVQ